MSKVQRKHILPFFSWDGKEQLTCVTWVTFSVTFCVRSLILLGAMISISVGEGGLIRSEPNVRVTCGMRPMVRCLIRSESEVEFRVLGLRSTTQNNSISSQVKKKNLWKSRLNRKREEYDWNLYKRKRFLMKYFPWERRLIDVQRWAILTQTQSLTEELIIVSLLEFLLGSCTEGRSLCYKYQSNNLTSTTWQVPNWWEICWKLLQLSWKKSVLILIILHLCVLGYAKDILSY